MRGVNRNGSALLDAVERGVANQAARPADLVHDRVTGVDAGGAVHAFHLRAVADIDAGRADRDALLAVDAIAEAAARRVVPRFRPRCKRPALFAALMIVGDDHGVLVEHRSIGTGRTGR